ncbi:MAG: YggT family protein [Bifidobacterium mongoliense]|jgi:YggT family protein|uniref:Hemolysin n=2 Tax=Bifidobacterium mongoliense TaxID=518643 RepID=A0A087BUU9_9BIFI|nr:YggT family protein [Bifidobacterium mongoliense]KFI74799.1 hemolysin [Bifidobacterium mongoliense DSM 21395]MDN5632879.1 YggT family protein [Bifidobacterium mongoliense]MDN5978892.1 YggT family protein [Bifidobacterium mongoliense]MDN6024672.1 YggT family protein [Bifidobacterium mongoliense]MDN6051259.1 YggT family protein [Bifidobacterium mongoliense]
MLLLILMRVLDWAINVYITVLFIRMILDWVAVLAPRWYPRGIVVALINVVYRITDPPLRWLRRFIPPLRMGPVAFDLSFIVLYFALIMLQVII